MAESLPPDDPRQEARMPGSILESPNLITTEELAEFLRITPHAVHMQRLRDQKPGSLGIRVGQRVLFRPESIAAWLEETHAAQATG